MKKSLKLFTLAFALMFAVVVKVNAATDITTEKELRDCVAVDGSTCKLANDIVLTSDLDIEDEMDIILDLNGHTITADSALTLESCLIAVVHGGTLTINDSVGTGKISPGSNIYGAVQVTKYGKENTSKTATLIVNGGTLEGHYYGIQGNGSDDRSNTNIIINGGTIKGLNEGDNLGIYHPQYGTLSITGGTITGTTGLEIRSGVLLVTGGKITGTGSPSSSTANDNGSTTIGAGIAVAQHNTKNDITVAILGGTIEGHTALYESNPQGNAVSDTNKVQVAVLDGTFNAINGGTEAVHNETTGAVQITGGTYNTEIADELLTVDSKLEEVNGSYVAKTAWDIEISETENGTVTTVEKAYPGETVKLDIKAKEGYKVASIEVLDGFGEEVEVKDNSFTMTNSPVSVEVTFEKEEVKEEVKEPSKVEEPNPDTGDNVITFVVIGLISLIAAGFVVNKLRKNA